VHECFIEIRPSSGADPGEIDPGFYIVEDGALTLTDSDGRPLTPKNDSILTHELANGENPETIARRMHRTARRPELTEFNRRLRYQVISVA
jgi:hypothetical protein